jgi:hypothetical protein
MANAMGIENFSTAVEWRPLALRALNGPTPQELLAKARPLHSPPIAWRPCML